MIPHRWTLDRGNHWLSVPPAGADDAWARASVPAALTAAGVPEADHAALSEAEVTALAGALLDAAGTAVDANASLLLLLVPPGEGPLPRLAALLHDYEAPDPAEGFTLLDLLGVLAPSGGGVPTLGPLRRQLLTGRAGRFVRQSVFTADPAQPQSAVSEIVQYVWHFPTLSTVAVLSATIPSGLAGERWGPLFDALAASLREESDEPAASAVDDDLLADA